jgi:hypothetical protein
MSGAMPASFTTLSFLQRLCAERHQQYFVGAAPAQSPVCVCRRAFGNNLEGPVPQSLLAMRLVTGSCAGLL